MNDRVRNDVGLSDALGAVVLISVVALGIAVASVAILSSPVPDRIPAVSVDIFNTSNTVFIRHDGGDTLVRGEYRIFADDRDRTSEFLSGGTQPAQWSVGDTLEYHVSSIDEIPSSVRIVAFTGKSEQVIMQVQLRPPTLMPTSSVTPTGSTTTTTTSSTTTTTVTSTTTTTVPAPVAQFSGQPLSGTRPLLVRYTDLSTNSPTSWSWDFGDGDTSTLQSPVHTYTTAGTFTVNLTATNGGGSDTETKTGYITVTNPPTSIVKFVLMYAQTASVGRRNTPVPGFDPIPDGVIILPSQYNNEPVTIRAVTDPEPTGSVRLVLTGTASRTQTENIVPYCLFGDDPQGQYNPWIPTPPVYGSYQLTGTPFTGSGATGTAGTPLTISFTFAPPPTTPTTTTTTPTPTPTSITKNVVVSWSPGGLGDVYLLPSTTLSNPQTVTALTGSSPSFSFVPKNNKYVQTIMLDGSTVYSGSSVGTSITYTISNIMADHTLVATFG